MKKAHGTSIDMRTSNPTDADGGLRVDGDGEGQSVADRDRWLRLNSRQDL